MRLINVPVANRPECRVALDAAFALAASLGAHVAGYHIRAERHEQNVALPPLLPDDGVHAAFTLADPKARARARAARELYRRVAAKHGLVAERPAHKSPLQASWHEVAGTPARVFAVVGPVADLTVVSRPAAEGPGRARAFLLGALLCSAKPVLVLPQQRQATLGRRIALAWDQSADAAAAVTAALPLLTRAERVVIASAGRQRRLGPSAAQLKRYLAHWGVAVKHERTGGADVPRELERAFHRLEADLLVMGAYSRSRFRQLVFGGVTEHMLFKTDIPVLLLHR